MAERNSQQLFLERKLAAEHLGTREGDFEAPTCTLMPTPMLEITDKHKIIAVYSPRWSEVRVDDDCAGQIPTLQRVFKEYDAQFKTRTIVATYDFLCATAARRQIAIFDQKYIM
jgi:hypothetical protein